MAAGRVKVTPQLSSGPLSVVRSVLSSRSLAKQAAVPQLATAAEVSLEKEADKYRRARSLGTGTVPDISVEVWARSCRTGWSVAR
jgi:hypothetical protein